jgi:hypothetical protein
MQGGRGVIAASSDEEGEGCNVGPWNRVARRGALPGLRLFAVGALAMLVVGCGVTPSTKTSNSGAASTATPSAVSLPAASQTPTGGSSAVACPEGSHDAGNPVLILTPTTSGRAGSAHIDDMVTTW